MKKVLLSIACLFVLTSAMSQTTNEQLAGNIPNGSMDGFTFDWAPNGSNDVGTINCMQATGALGTSNIYVDIFGSGSAGYAANGFAVSHDGTNFHIQGNGTGASNSIFYLRLPMTNCGVFGGTTAGNSLDISSDLRCEFKAKVASGTLAIQPFATVNQGGYYEADQSTNTASLTTTATVFKVALPSHHWDGTAADMTKTIGFGFIIPNTAAFDITIEYLKIGADAALAGTQSINMNDALTIAPNPASDVINVDLSQIGVEAGATAKLTNSTGAVVFETAVTSTSFPISVATLNKGIYVLQVTSGDKVATKKVVVQ